MGSVGESFATRSSAVNHGDGRSFMMKTENYLRWLLRLFGGSTCLAFFAALLPTDWMAAIHGWLGVGTMPRGPIVEYLTRSISLLYAYVGGMFLLASFDVRRYGPLIDYLAIATVVMGVLLVVVDEYAGMPWYWTAAEGPGVAVIVGVMWWLNRRTGRARPAERATLDEGR